MNERCTESAVVLLPLFRAARDGDGAALNELLAALYHPLRRYALRQCRSAIDQDDLAKELAQEALIRIATQLAGCRANSDEQLLAWSLSIIRHLGLDHYRARARSREVRLSPMSEVLLPCRASGSQTRYSRPMRVLTRLLREAWTALPPSTRQVLKLKARDSSTWREIGDELQTTPSAARRRFQRAQRSAQNAITQQLDSLSVRDRDLVQRFLPEAQ